MLAVVTNSGRGRIQTRLAAKQFPDTILSDLPTIFTPTSK